MNIQEIRQKYPQYSDIGDRELLTALHGKFYQDMPINDFFGKVGFKQGAATQVLNDPITQGALNPAGSMSGGERFLAGAGKAMTEFGQGAAQSLAENINPMKAGPLAPVAGVVRGLASRLAPSPQEVVEQRDRDTSLMATPEGFTGNLAGGAAMALPAAAAGPTVPAAMMAGSIYGGATPTGPGESRALNTGIGATISGGLQGAMGGIAGAMTNRANRPQPQPTVRQETFRAGQAEGLQVPPSAVSESWLTRRLEGIGGKAAMGQEAAVRNQPVIDRIARREAGLNAGENITVESLSMARERLAQPYREVARLSPTASDALNQLNQVRIDKGLAWNEFNRNGARIARAEALQLQATEDALEATISQEAQNAGRPELVNQLRQARVNLAKNHTVQQAVNKGSGEVDASVIGRMFDNERPLSGGLETIGRFQQAFPSFVREGGRVPTPGVSALEPVAGAVGGILGGSAGGPGGALLGGGLPLLRGPARSMLFSDSVQGALANPGAQQMPTLITDPRLRGLLGPMSVGTYFSQQ